MSKSKNKLAVLKLINGNFEDGFPVTLQIGEEGHQFLMEITGKLPPAPDIPKFYEQWQLTYRNLDLSFRIKIIEVNKFSNIQNCHNAALRLRDSLNVWLNSEEFRLVKERLMQYLDPSDTIRFILQTEDYHLRRLPWHLWDFFETYGKAEVVLSSLKYDHVGSIGFQKNKIRILCIFGQSEGINVEQDKLIFEKNEKNSHVDSEFLLEPKPSELNEKLYEKRWDILFFAGHSDSQDSDETGLIYLNHNDTLTIEELKISLQRAIKKGLKLAIFNSCNGLGLARALEDWKIPQVIVMREVVPDKVAQEFLSHFLKVFSKGKPLHLAVRESRENLEKLESEYPCASWLPVISSNPTEIPPTWPILRNKRNFVRLPSFLQQNVASLSFLVILTALVTAFLTFQKVDFFANSLLKYHQNSCEKLTRTTICHRLADVPKVPRGTFNYGNSTTFAALRDKNVIAIINKAHPGFQLKYTESPSLKDSPGSSTGIRMLLEGQLSFAQSSRSVKKEEFEDAKKRGFTLEQIPVAIDAIAFYVNPKLIDQGLKGITLAEARDIYLGKIKNWSQVRGPDVPITAFTRKPEDGGTVDFFIKNVLGEQKLGASVQRLEYQTDSIHKVASTPGAISYATASQVIHQTSIRVLPLAKGTNSLFVSPCDSNSCTIIDKTALTNNSYPLTRRLFIVIKRDGGLDENAGLAYVNILLSDEGQKLIEKQGFLPIRGEEMIDAVKTHL